MTPPRRIGVVTTSYPRWPGDAAGGFVRAHAQALAAATGATVEVIAADAPGASIVDGNIAVHRVAAAPGLFYTGGAPDALEAGASARAAAVFALRLAAAVGRHARGWDSIVAHWLAPSALAALPSRGPLLAIGHGGDVHLLARAGLLPMTMALLAARRARLVFVSGALRQLALDAAPRRLRARLADASAVVPMGVEVASIVRAPRPARPRILVLARLVPIKGVDVVLAALASIDRPVELHVAGDGPARAALQAAATRHPCVWHGTVDTTTRDALLAAADVVVIPSRVLPSGRSEGLPQVALEALAAGVPLVATRTGGLADLPAPVVLVPPDDATALAAAITATLAAPPPAEALRGLADRHRWAVVEPALRAHWLAAT